MDTRTRPTEADAQLTVALSARSSTPNRGLDAALLEILHHQLRAQSRQLAPPAVYFLTIFRPPDEKLLLFWQVSSRHRHFQLLLLLLDS